MSYLKAIDRENVEHTIETTEGLSLMEILKAGGLDVEAVCGGQCVCSTCHVYVDHRWLELLSETSEEEQVMVEDTGHYQENSRLACQVVWQNRFEGLSLKLAPEF